MPTVNGSLWTLPVEFACYILCFILYKIGFFKKKWFPWLIPAVVAANIALPLFLNEGSVLLSALRPVTLFFIGVGFYIYRDHIRLSFGLSAIFTAIIVRQPAVWSAAAHLSFAVTLCFVHISIRFSASSCALRQARGIFIRHLPLGIPHSADPVHLFRLYGTSAEFCRSRRPEHPDGRCILPADRKTGSAVK